MTDYSTPRTEPSGNASGRRPQARVALALLEALRDLDRPGEVLDDENVSITLPRRFGLSGVVDAQIRRYEQEARRGRRVPEAEVRDLIHLATRRPDAVELFHHVGRSLTAADGAPAWRAILPERLALGMAARRIRRRLGALFGGKIVAPSRGPFRLHAVSDLLVEEDPSGEACALVTGLAQGVVEVYGPTGAVVEHHACRGRGGQRCAWRLIRPASQANGAGNGTNDAGEGRR